MSNLQFPVDAVMVYALALGMRPNCQPNLVSSGLCPMAPLRRRITPDGVFCFCMHAKPAVVKLQQTVPLAGLLAAGSGVTASNRCGRFDSDAFVGGASLRDVASAGSRVPSRSACRAHLGTFTQKPGNVETCAPVPTADAGFISQSGGRVQYVVCFILGPNQA